MDRLYELTVTVPASTPIAAPTSTPWLLEDATLKRIEILVPPGHNGLTGIRILWSGQQIIPWGNLSWLIANDRLIPVGFDDYMTISGLVVVTYNTDIFPHSFYLNATVSDLPASSDLARQSGPSAVILPATPANTVDPLSPDALLASLPADVAANIQANSLVGVP